MKTSLQMDSVRIAAAGMAVCILIGAGCATAPIDAARYDYWGGYLERAERELTGKKVAEKDKVLFLMERGTIRQALGKYEESSGDFIEASDLLDQLEFYSVSKNTTSFVVNDTVQNFRGTPFERTLLHVFTALNHLAEAKWDEAAVEARRTVRTLLPEVRGPYPEDAYSRYLSGFCFEMIDDPSNAELMYRQAGALLKEVGIDPRTGRLSGQQTNSIGAAAQADKSGTHELVCFVMIGRSPTGDELLNKMSDSTLPMYAEIYHKGRLLGRSYNLADTVQLAFTTAEQEAVRKALKTTSRVVVKEAIAAAVESRTNSDEMGDLVRLVLVGLLERPDVRRWETLPRWLQVARVPCPPDLKEYDIVFKSAYGGVVRKMHVEEPISRRRNTYVSFCRDMPVAKASHPDVIQINR